MNTSTQKRNIWQRPWGFVEGYLILLGLFAAGGILEYTLPVFSTSLLVWPTNIILLVLFCITIVLAYLQFKHTYIIQWLSSAQAAISAISGMGFLIILMGIFPQWIDYAEHDSIVSKLGLRSILESRYFLLTTLFFVLTLSLATCKNMFVAKKRNIGVLLSHLGLLTITLAVPFGSGDLQKVSMELGLQKQVWHGKTANNDTVQFPFALELTDFVIEEFNPKLATIGRSGEIIDPQTKMFEITDSTEGVIGDWEFVINSFYHFAHDMPNGSYQPVYQLGAVPAALITMTHIKSGIKKQGWISCGSFMVRHQGLVIDDTTTVVMALPEAKKFRSTVQLYQKGERPTQHTIEVNNPITVQGWDIYQVSYDSKMGRWSKLSVVELVKDPWLPVIYTGIFMMLAGALYLLWFGNKRYEVTHVE